MEQTKTELKITRTEQKTTTAEQMGTMNPTAATSVQLMVQETTKMAKAGLEQRAQRG